ncbi:Gamma-aminobutyric acid receptor subunit rho-3 [Lonchura striata]|uniref:GABA(C) receptor n=1 Tax=Lonchura striata TaxID=40157 RepID=A0A218V2M7_9PASE|nr:Gamma-aminobutyric acid receptor subunit rho-3 [Lonchura striata domestica]
MRKLDSTKVRPLKSEQLLHIEDHDFALRPGFGGSPIPVGIDVQVESIDSISEVDMDFTMTLYLRHYWKDERLSFRSNKNKSMTFDGRLIKKIWVPDVFFVHSKRSFIHDTTVENIMLRVYPDGNVLFSLRITVSAMCFMDFSRFPLDTQNCSLELESYAYNEDDLMLYWKHGNKSLSTDEHISLSQFFIEEFSASSGLAFYSSTGTEPGKNAQPPKMCCYDLLQNHGASLKAIGVLILRESLCPGYTEKLENGNPKRGYSTNAVLQRQSMPQNSLDGTLSSKIREKALIFLCITTVLTMSTIMTGVSASMPQVSYIKAVDVYLWISFLFVFLSVIEYAAVNYLTTIEERKQLKKRGKASGMYSMDAVQAMAFDGCYHDTDEDMDLSPFPEPCEENETRASQTNISNADTPRLKRKRSLKGNVGRIILQNNHVIDTYSRIIFPSVYIVFNFFYWGLYI